ncbi:MAG: OmpA family protein [Gammaproteobacteria bacterium]|nr:OmpA family protein [Gammaproteobacteria bacterium]
MSIKKLGRRRRERMENKDEGEDWLLTYSDTVTLIMTFFVLMLSVSTIDQAKFDAVTEAVKEHGLSGNGKYVSPFEVLKEKMDQVTTNYHLQKDMTVVREPKGLTIELSSSALYEVGSADIQEEAKNALNAVAEAIKNFEYPRYRIEVEGHTDDVAISTQRYPSNWELSVHRATNVVRYLTQEGVPQSKMKATGYADTRPKVPNLDDNGEPIAENRAINRRIVIHVERDDNPVTKGDKK